MSQDIGQEEEKVPVWWSEEEESEKLLPVFSAQVAHLGQQQKEISLGRGQRINRARKESGTSSSSTTAFGATKRKSQEKGIGTRPVGRQPCFRGATAEVSRRATTQETTMGFGRRKHR